MRFRRRATEPPSVYDMSAVAANHSQIIQARGDVNLHLVVDQRFAEQRDVLGRADFVRVKLPERRSFTVRSEVRGRVDDLAFIRETLADGRNVVLAGPAGVGKTLLLEHAANTDELAVDGVEGVLWLAAKPFTTAEDVVQELVHACYEVRSDTVVPPNTVVPPRLARQLLDGIRALVVLDGLSLPLDQALHVVSSMPGSVFVVSTRREDLWRLGKQRVLGGLPLDDVLAIVREEVPGPPDASTVERDWTDREGNPEDVLERAELRTIARKLGVVPEKASDAGVLDQVVPIAVDSLSTGAKAALHALVAFGDVEWGRELLGAVSGSPDGGEPDALVAKRLARLENDRFRVTTEIAGPVPLRREPAPLVESITDWVAHARPDAVAGDVLVVTRALRWSLDQKLHDDALSLARAASTALARSRQWGALKLVVTLGVRAAVATGSVPDEKSFRYTLALLRLHDDQLTQAAELLIAAANLEDDRDEHLAARVREVNAEVQQLATRRPLSIVDNVVGRITDAGGVAVSAATAGVKAVQEACVNAMPAPRVVERVKSMLGEQVMRLETPLRFAREYPEVARRIVAGGVALISGLVLLASVLLPQDSSGRIEGLPGPGGPTATAPTETPPSGTTTVPDPSGTPQGGTRPGVAAPDGTRTKKTPEHDGTGHPDKPDDGTPDDGEGPAIPWNGEVTIDGTSSGYTAFSVSGTPGLHPTAQPFTFSIQPGDHVLTSTAYTTIPFHVAEDGRIGYSPAYDGVVSGRGTPTLRLRGFPVVLDATNLDYQAATISGTGVSQTRSKTVNLLPGRHFVQTPAGDRLDFEVTPTGLVHYEPAVDHVLDGEGTSTLTVVGKPITLDATDVDYANVSVGGTGWPTPQEIRTVRLLPGAHTMVTSAGTSFPFRVTPTGTIAYDSALDHVFDGADSTTLALRGMTIRVDATSTGTAYIAVDGAGWWPARTPHDYRLLPGAHKVRLHDQRAWPFTVTPTATITYDPSLDPPLDGRGTTTLTLR